jgi:hypothetical protein
MPSSIAQGASAGATLGTAFGPIGTAVGAVAGGALGAIPALIKTDAEKENARRLKELKRMQEMGALGLTDQERQALFNNAQMQAGATMQASQALASGAGASYGVTGAGNELVKQQLEAEKQARIQSQIAQQVELKDLERKRELEDEIQQRTAAKGEYQQERISALTGIGTEALGAGAEYKLSKGRDIQAKKDTAVMSSIIQKKYNIDANDANSFASFLVSNPENAKLFVGYADLLEQK